MVKGLVGGGAEVLVVVVEIGAELEGGRVDSGEERAC